MRLDVARLACGYVVPDGVSRPDESVSPIREATTIQQPKGYGAFTQTREKGASAITVLILGFSNRRADKFRRNYNMSPKGTFIVFGYPPAVDDGVERVKEAHGELFKEFERDWPANIVPLPALDSEAMRTFLKEKMKQVCYIDIVPLGPSALALGALQCYFGLPESRDHREGRSRIRFLYDFPAPRPRMSYGYRGIRLYDFDLKS